MNRTLIFLICVTLTLLALVYGVAMIDIPQEVKLAGMLIAGFLLGSFGMRA